VLAGEGKQRALLAYGSSGRVEKFGVPQVFDGCPTHREERDVRVLQDSVADADSGPSTLRARA
jgi:hypothetical protein